MLENQNLVVSICKEADSILLMNKPVPFSTVTLSPPLKGSF
jgi:hypothetical protein